MSIAASTILIFLYIYIPGMSFRRAYFQGPFSKEFRLKNIFDATIFAAIPGLILLTVFGLITHWISIFFYWKYESSKYVDWVGIFDKFFIFSNSKSENLKFAEYSISEITLIAIFFLSLNFFSWVLGYMSFKIVNDYKLHLKYKTLRFKNSWHYVFNNQIFDLKENKRRSDVVETTKNDSLTFDIDLSEYISELKENESLVLKIREEARIVPYLSVFIDDANRYCVYKGALADYKICPTTFDLKEVILQEAHRLDFNHETVFKNMKLNNSVFFGKKLLYLPIESVKNILVKYERMPLIDFEKNYNRTKVFFGKILGLSLVIGLVYIFYKILKQLMV